MSYNILGISLSHNSSVCVLKDGEIDFFLEEDRLSKTKHDPFPIQLLFGISSKFSIDEIAINGLSGFYEVGYYEKSLLTILNNLFPNTKLNLSLLKYHHQSHSMHSFFNSGFDKALSVVIDGGGDFNEVGEKENFEGYETETLQIVELPLKTKDIYKSYITTNLNKSKNNIDFSSLVSLARVYEEVTKYFGWGPLDCGKTMGLSSYGKEDKNINLYIGSKGNPKIIQNIDLKGNLMLDPISKDWHKNPSKVTNFEKNLAYKVQQESQQAVGNLIEKGLKETGLKQVCCSGGYFLNCVANYYLVKRFPDIEFYFEPVSSDAGISIGVAKSAWYKKTQDKTIRPQKTLYYGPKYTKEQLLKGIQKYLD